MERDKEIKRLSLLFARACYVLGQARVSLGYIGRGYDLGKRLDEIPKMLDQIKAEAQEAKK